MLVSIDLEAFYEKSNSLAVDVRTVREGIYRVMDKNQTKHSHNLRLMFDQRNDITAYSQAIATKKQHLATYIAHLDSLMDRLAEKEKQTIEQIVHIQDKHNTPSLSGLQSDISKSHEVSRFETQLTKFSVTHLFHFPICPVRSQNSYCTCTHAQHTSDSFLQICPMPICIASRAVSATTWSNPTTN
jgi:uncharacterized coiled-coil protein SlyX